MANSAHNLQPALDEQGLTASPQLPEGVKNYLIDIDGTVTEDVPNEEPERMATCEPFEDALETLNKWHDEGHIITFFTSRTEEHREVTEENLVEAITTGWTITSFAPRVMRDALRIWCANKKRWRSSKGRTERIAQA